MPQPAKARKASSSYPLLNPARGAKHLKQLTLSIELSLSLGFVVGYEDSPLVLAENPEPGVAMLGR